MTQANKKADRNLKKVILTKFKHKDDISIPLVMNKTNCTFLRAVRVCKELSLSNSDKYTG